MFRAHNTTTNEKTVCMEKKGNFYRQRSNTSPTTAA